MLYLSMGLVAMVLAIPIVWRICHRIKLRCPCVVCQRRREAATTNEFMAGYLCGARCAKDDYSLALTLTCCPVDASPGYKKGFAHALETFHGADDPKIQSAVQALYFPQVISQ